MINSILIKNFKSFENLEFNCKKLNVITGANSSGKSTLLQAILLLAQNSHTTSGLNGDFISIGEFKDAKNFNSSEKRIEIAADFESTKDSNAYNLIFDNDRGIQNDFYNDDLNAYCPPKELQTIRYLSCNRIGVEDIYKKNPIPEKNVGINGQYTIFCIEKYKNETLPNELICSQDSYTLLSQVNYWLDKILSATITTEDVVGTDYVKCFYTTEYGKNIRPKNIGAGLSYLISVLVMCLLSEKNQVLIIENPEIHLHPKAQSKVCEFLYFIAQSGRQVFVESHSDHIFNGIRAGLATKIMDPEIVSVNFFTMNDRKCTENNIIEFGTRGRILNNKEGLFDQFDADLNRMLNLRGYNGSNT